MKTIIGKKVTDFSIMCTEEHGDNEAQSIVITVEDGTKVEFNADSILVDGEEEPLPIITYDYVD